MNFIFKVCTQAVFITFLSLLAQTAYSQSYGSDYLFVEVKDVMEKAVAKANVRVSDKAGAQLANVQTNQDGQARLIPAYRWGSERNDGDYGYIVQASKAGYQTFEDVYFIRYIRSHGGRRIPIKIQLLAPPRTGAKRLAAEIDQRNHDLLVAIKKNELKKIQALLLAGANPNSKGNSGISNVESKDPMSGEVAALTLARQVEIVEALLKAGANVNTKNAGGRSVLHQFIINAHNLPISAAETVKITKRLLAAGAKVNEADQNGRTALFDAMNYSYTICRPRPDYPSNCSYETQNSFDLVKTLLDAGADVKVRDKLGRTALTELVQTQSPGVQLARRESISERTLQLLIKAGADVNAADHNGKTPLMEAYYDASVAQALIQAGAKVDAVDNKGRTPLIIAADLAYYTQEIVSLLLASGAAVNATDHDGNTALILVTNDSNGHNRDNDEALETIKMLAASGVNINAKNNEGKTALMYAVAKTYLAPQYVSALLTLGAKVNEADNNGQTALMYAMGKSHKSFDESIKLVTALLATGADVDQADNNGNTVLITAPAIASSNQELFKTLINAGANVNAKNKDGKTALFFAAYHNDINLIKKLLEAKADINAIDNNGQTALMHAIRVYISIDCIKALIEAGADVNMVDKNGQTVLMRVKQLQPSHYFSKEKIEEIIRLLETAGAR